MTQAHGCTLVMRMFCAAQLEQQVWALTARGGALSRQLGQCSMPAAAAPQLPAQAHAASKGKAAAQAAAAAGQPLQKMAAAGAGLSGRPQGTVAGSKLERVPSGKSIALRLAAQEVAAQAAVAAKKRPAGGMAAPAGSRAAAPDDACSRWQVRAQALAVAFSLCDRHKPLA
jgi:hypothetical protein